MRFLPIQNYQQVIFEALPIPIDCLYRNTLNMMVLCLCYSLSYIYYLSLYIDVLHDIFHLLFPFPAFVACQFQLPILILF